MRKRMFIGIVFALILTGIILGLRLTHGRGFAGLRVGSGTVYVFNDHGYTAFSTGKTSHIHRTSKGGLEKAVRHLLLGDVFDTLWVSTRDDKYSGAMLEMQSGTPVLSLNFKTHSEQAKLVAFKKSMASSGFVSVEESDGFNGGRTEEFRITCLEFRLAKSSDKILEAIQSAFANLDPDAHDVYFVEGLNVRDILGPQPRVKFVPDSDPLKGIL